MFPPRVGIQTPQLPKIAPRYSAHDRRVDGYSRDKWHRSSIPNCFFSNKVLFFPKLSVQTLLSIQCFMFESNSFNKTLLFEQTLPSNQTLPCVDPTLPLLKQQHSYFFLSRPRWYDSSVFIKVFLSKFLSLFHQTLSL